MVDCELDGYDVLDWISDYNADLVRVGVGTLYCHDTTLKKAYKKMNAIYASLEAVRCFCVDRRLALSAIEFDEMLARCRTIVGELEEIAYALEDDRDPDIEAYEARMYYKQSMWDASNDR